MFYEFTHTHAFIIGLVVGVVVTLFICGMLVEKIGNEFIKRLWK